jgi:hypothetical protein
MNKLTYKISCQQEKKKTSTLLSNHSFYTGIFCAQTELSRAEQQEPFHKSRD